MHLLWCRLTLAPVSRVGPAGVGLHHCRQLVDDQLEDLYEQRNIGPSLWVCGGQTYPITCALHHHIQFTDDVSDTELFAILVKYRGKIYTNYFLA